MVWNQENDSQTKWGTISHIPRWFWVQLVIFFLFIVDFMCWKGKKRNKEKWMILFQGGKYPPGFTAYCEAERRDGSLNEGRIPPHWSFLEATNCLARCRALAATRLLLIPEVWLVNQHKPTPTVAFSAPHMRQIAPKAERSHSCRWFTGLLHHSYF